MLFENTKGKIHGLNTQEILEIIFDKLRANVAYFYNLIVD